MRSANLAVASLWALVVLLLVALAAAQPATKLSSEPQGSVTLPLSRWRALSAEANAERSGAATPVLWISRRIEGHFRKGLWTGRLTARFEVGHDIPVRVPVLDVHAIVGNVTLDGKSTALAPEANTYVLPIQQAGRHDLVVDFHWGRESQRFTRSLDLTLPEGGPVLLKARIAEVGIAPHLSPGALVSTTEQGGETVVVGQLDGTGALRLSWKRTDPDEPRGEAKMETRMHTLFHVSDALVTGQSAIVVHLTQGETDTVELSLPQGVEVLRVEGDDVLQWHAIQGKEGRGLVVFFRRLISEQTSLRVDFQLSADPSSVISLIMPMPEVPTKGAIGVVGPPGLQLSIKQTEGAEPLSARELPQELTSLTKVPVLFGYRMTGTPRITVDVAPLPELEIARTVVDELSASTVLLDDGMERTKVALRIRNDGRQYVELALPDGARPMRSFVDGREVRPALLGQRLLLPLRQSEHLGEKEARKHRVRPGETLSDVANLYYSDPSAWQRILTHNPNVVDANGSLVRDVDLVIPPASEAANEAFFVIEVAYERAGDKMSGLGLRTLRLPGLDVDTTKAVWHVYLPASYEPLVFQGNLSQMSRIKYDLFRRLKWYLDSALVPNANAGGDYKSILQKRRDIYNDEATQEGESFAALTTFPLVGERYRFRRILLGREVAELRVMYASDSWLSVARLGALALVFGAALFALRRGGRWPAAAVAAIVVLLLVMAHFVPGLHRRIVWGLDFALIVALVWKLRPDVARLWRVLRRAPWLLFKMVTVRRLIAVGAFAWLLGQLVQRPMLLSLATLVLLGAVWYRFWAQSRSMRQRHAV